MARLRLLAALPLALGALSCDLFEKGPSGPTALFNGTDLEGWDFYLADPSKTMDDVWSVKDGAIVCKGDPFGYLVTKEEYTSYRLLVEWRWPAGTQSGNSGVLMRVNGEPRVIPRCIEAQLQMGNAGDVLGLQGMAASGDPARSFSVEKHELAGDISGIRKMEAAENPAGEWNVYEIVLDGPKVEVSINGKKVNEARGLDVLAGPIALQSEGGEVHFRRVELTPIE